MNRIATLLRRVWLLVRRDAASRELEEEMRLHRELRAESLRDAGVDAREANAAAARRFGNATTTTERARDEWGFASMNDLLQDLRYATRRLVQRPGFTLSVVGILALGIGATTAMFSAVDAAMLKPLPFERASELVAPVGINIPFDPGPGQKWRGDGPALATFDIKNLQAMPETFASVAAYAAGGLNLADEEQPLRVSAGVVTADFFKTLGVSPLKGRTFRPEDGVPGAPSVVVISWGLWQRQFGGADVVGKSIPLSARKYEIVGVMPRGFSFPKESDLWIPMSIPTTFETFASFRGWLPATVIARVAPGVSTAAADARLFAKWEQYIASLPREPGKRHSMEATFDDVRTRGAAPALQATLIGDRKRGLLVLLGATGLLLLIASVNVTSLLLSHGASRRRELAVRAVLGATRGRVVRQLLSESVLLSATGAIIGIALAPLLLRILTALMPPALAGLAPPHIDVRVLAFATVLGVLTGLAFGLWPAFGATRDVSATAIKAGGGHGATAAGTRRAQHFLVAAEIALTTMLLVGAGLMLRSFDQLARTDSGFDARQTATLEFSFSRGSATPAERGTRLEAIVDRLNDVAGISAAGVTTDLPLRADGGIAISVKSDNPAVTVKDPFVRMLAASEDYFTAMGIALKRGRFFTRADNAPGANVAIINEAMAHAFWPGLNPVDRTFTWGGDSLPIRIVGVVASVRESGLEHEAPTQMFFPIRANNPMNVAIVARGTLSPSALLAQLTTAVGAVDPSQAVHNVRMMRDVIGASVASRRANTTLIVLFGALGLVVSVLGVYAVTSYAVAQRARELGIRAALGATRRDLLRHIGGNMTWVTIVGVAAGAGLAWSLSKVMSGLLYGVTTHDAATFIAAPFALVLAVVVATLVPARRATRVNPVEVMRAE
ncbi:MAG TPA: ABC transporter permease [Gemmatimonadaceae bacterium]|nr:ABC transporter permease [Gemmatimonadaceae bacterium]